MTVLAPLKSLLPHPHEILPGYAPADEEVGTAAAPTASPDTASPDTASPDSERRSGERSEERVALDLVIFTYPLEETERAPSRSETRNVSTTGMFVATQRPPAKGQVLFLEAFPNGSDEEAVRSRAVVRWRRRWLEPRGMGVELLDVGDEERERLRRWMERAT